jgi:hypothetical protein
LGTTRSGDDSVFTASGSPSQIATWEAADTDGSDHTPASSATGVAWSRPTANNLTPPPSDATATRVHHRHIAERSRLMDR